MNKHIEFPAGAGAFVPFFPDELKQRKQWVIYVLGVKPNKKGKLQKYPIYTNTLRMRKGEQGSDQDLKNLVDFDTAFQTLNSLKKSGKKLWTPEGELPVTGLGFAMLKGRGLTCIDIDPLCKKELREEIVSRCSSFTEKSVSGKGLHVWVQYDCETFKNQDEGTDLEIFSDTQFIAVTGDIQTDVTEVKPLSEENFTWLESIVKKGKYAPKPKQQRQSVGQPNKAFSSPDKEKVRQALMSIPADIYDDWLNIGFAIYSEFGEDGFDIFNEWASKGATYTFESCHEKYFNQCCKVSDITIATVFGLSNQNKILSDFENVDLKKAEVAAEHPEQNEDSLPPLPEQLKALPGGLGHLQVYVYNTMTYPCLYTAGWVALATMAGFAQSHLTINSLSGLGFNEYFLTLAPTGFGKESLRDPLNVLLRNLDDTFNFENLPTVEHSAPSSKQGLHQVIQSVQNHSVYVQSDEFAEWLKGAKKDPNKHAALSYLMEIYSKANRTIHPGRAVSGDYKPIEKPRLSVFSTTTAESLLSTLDKNTAEMGAYNRWVMYVAPTERIQKKYTGLEFEPRQEAIEAVKWVAELESQNIKIDKNAFDMMVHFDSKYAENIKFTDAVIGGRITEQAIKIAGLFALSDRRTTINAQDMQIAYEIRLGLYYRAKEMINQSGAISGSHETGKALEQLREKLKTRASIYLSQLHNFSRAYEKLDVRAQDAVIQALIREGAAQMHPDGKRILVSLICK